jgi:imidazolonepropionase-like amidohydrolase
LIFTPDGGKDYRLRSRMGSVSPHMEGKSLRSFSDEELQVMVKTARQLGVKVAVHASTVDAVEAALEAGVDTIEHGHELGLSDKVLQKFINQPQTLWVPTLSVYYKIYGSDHPAYRAVTQSFQAAIQANMKNIAVGGDTGAFPHGENALELKLMARLGISWTSVLQKVTLGGWECVRPRNWEEVQDGIGENEIPFGIIKPGFAADIIALEGDLEKDFEATLDRVRFVMKSGIVHKMHGQQVLQEVK